MTREEAIEVLKDIYNYTRFDTYTTNEARTMAIKALEQEPCDDCVSRQAVLDEVRAIATWHSGDAFNEDRVITHMKMLPSVLPKREENTVSEEVYTEEYTRRKALEYENYVLKQNMQALRCENEVK